MRRNPPPHTHTLDLTAEQDDSSATRAGYTPTIVGPDNPTVGSYVIYGVNLATRVDGVYWTITPNTYTTVSHDPYEQILEIKFEAPGTYTITGGVDYGGGYMYPITRTVTASLVTPVVTSDPAFSVANGHQVTFTVNNPMSGVSYEWEILEGGTASQNNTPGAYYFRVLARGHQTNSVPLRVRCRATVNGQYTSWSKTVSLSIAPGTPGGPIVDDPEPEMRSAS